MIPRGMEPLMDNRDLSFSQSRLHAVTYSEVDDNFPEGQPNKNQKLKKLRTNSLLSNHSQLPNFPRTR